MGSHIDHFKLFIQYKWRLKDADVMFVILILIEDHLLNN